MGDKTASAHLLGQWFQKFDCFGWLLIICFNPLNSLFHPAGIAACILWAARPPQDPDPRQKMVAQSKNVEGGIACVCPWCRQRYPHTHGTYRINLDHNGSMDKPETSSTTSKGQGCVTSAHSTSPKPSWTMHKAPSLSTLTTTADPNPISLMWGI